MGIGIIILSFALALFISLFAFKVSADKVFSKRTQRIGTWTGAIMQWVIVAVLTFIIWVVILVIAFIILGISLI